MNTPVLETLAELGVAGGGFGERQLGGGGLLVGGEEGGVVAEARGARMPTPMRRAGVVACCGLVSCSVDIKPPERWCKESSRGGPPAQSDEEEACDKRSKPQDVTSPWSDTEGPICSKRSYLSRPKGLPASPHKRIPPAASQE
jgi:hypothetical protein